MKTIKSNKIGPVGKGLLKETLEAVSRMKKLSVAGRTARQKHPVGSCVDPEDEKPGEAKSFSDLEVEVKNLFYLVSQLEHEKVLPNNPTNIILDIIYRWNDLAGGLSRRNKVPGSELFDKKGNSRIQTSWIILGLTCFYGDFVGQRYGDESGKVIQRKLRNSVSSFVSRIFKSLVIMGLADKDDSLRLKGPPSNCYILDKNKIEKLTFEQFFYLYKKGCILCEKVERGEFVRKRFKSKGKQESEKVNSPLVIFSGNEKLVKIVFKKNPKAIKTKILPNGKITLEIAFR